MSQIICSKCDGTGKIQCPDCFGDGYEENDNGYGTHMCRACWGDGVIKCPSCNGTGYIEKDD